MGKLTTAACGAAAEWVGLVALVYLSRAKQGGIWVRVRSRLFPLALAREVVGILHETNACGRGTK